MSDYLSLTFVVPVKKEAIESGSYARCLLSLMEQRSLYPLEILVVVDQVEDNAAETITKQIEKTERTIQTNLINPMTPLCLFTKNPAGNFSYPDHLVLVSPDKLGPGGARNLGIKVASSTWIWCIDADDWLTDPYAADKVLNDIKSTRIKNLAGVQFASFQGPFPCQKSNMMPWLRVVKKSVLLEAPFPKDVYKNEDLTEFRLLLSVIKKEHLKLGSLDRNPYFYNWMCVNSTNALSGGVIPEDPK